MFMDIYAAIIRGHMAQYGTTQETIAKVAVKSHHHGALNPRAQYQDEVTVEEVLASREVAYPLTLLMCSPIGDGAAAALIVSPEYAKKKGLDGPKVAASVIVSGNLPDSGNELAAPRAAMPASVWAGRAPEHIVGPAGHDAPAAAEIRAYE